MTANLNVRIEGFAEIPPNKRGVNTNESLMTNDEDSIDGKAAKRFLNKKGPFMNRR
jgi:hypothetical protein